jgi:hypothetical protein
VVGASVAPAKPAGGFFSCLGNAMPPSPSTGFFEEELLGLDLWTFVPGFVSGHERDEGVREHGWERR